MFAGLFDIDIKELDLFGCSDTDRSSNQAFVVREGPQLPEAVFGVLGRYGAQQVKSQLELGENVSEYGRLRSVSLYQNGYKSTYPDIAIVRQGVMARLNHRGIVRFRGEDRLE